jgi:serine/threonine-protein phosphatase 2B regulatory subunit
MGVAGSKSKLQQLQMKGKWKGGKTRITAKDAPTAEQITQLSKRTKFNEQEIRALWLKFKRMSESRTPDGRIDMDEFQAALGIRSEGFATRIFAAFDSDVSLEIDFTEFVLGVYAMSPRASIEEKAQFCFNFYDFDGNGSIDRQEISQILHLSLSESQSITLTEEQIQKIIDRTYERVDRNGDGGISFEEFLAASRRNPQILACININLDALFTIE